MAISKALADELEKRRAVALEGGGKKKADDRHAKGRMTARERLGALYSKGTFQEFGLHAQHKTRHFGMADKVIPTDGVITGTGFIDGRPVAAFSQDFGVVGGSLGEVHAKKICNALDHAGKAGVPVVGFNDSGGARIQEGVGALSGYGQVFYRNVQLSGVVPQISVIAGPCAGGAAYSPALTDFIIMTREHASMFICGPEVIRAVTGQVCTMDEIGSAQAHASVSGNIHFIAENDAHAVALVHRLLSFLPSNNMMDPPHRIEPDLKIVDDVVLDELVPDDPKKPYDCREVIKRLADEADFLEVMEQFAANIVIGFGRVGGVVVGFVANQPTVKAGTLDIDASDKAARFVRFCNVYNIPIVTLVDVPGFLPGINEERRGIIRHGAKMLFAYASATVPKITVIMRKAYGGAYLAMCSEDMGADRVIAWPTAEIAVMGAEGAVNILYRKEMAEADDKVAKAKELADEYRTQFATPYLSAGMLAVHDIIQPRETKSAIALTLRGLMSKRETRPPKKHGNIPL
ncbi:acyl-CoA carboxylase subunit beta [Cohaesibacter celericrescens]|uniref:Methylmalonyl-CoA carboxyltransferase n=1 Tax=Cohaesibacter celericrescens TaxID=2067669 RepID=A0A2N5XNB1_9HYPH|nr:carboxyl transferase domain-containing protein [Cohaesibacter celericrescens]PLW75972.1 methylmalonyl-CoA carboxyltransferase [Cohaesibacter celericrescens]